MVGLPDDAQQPIRGGYGGRLFRSVIHYAFIAIGYRMAVKYAGYRILLTVRGSAIIMTMRTSFARLFDTFNYLFLILAWALCIFPILHVLAEQYVERPCHFLFIRRLAES